MDNNVFTRVVPSASPDGVPPLNGIQQTSLGLCVLKLDCLIASSVYFVWSMFKPGNKNTL